MGAILQRDEYTTQASGLPIRQPAQRFPGEPAEDPVALGRRAEGVVEGDGRGVPVEHRPLQPRQALVAAAQGEPAKQRRPRAWKTGERPTRGGPYRYTTMPPQ